jgi:hypothetical protein
VDDSGVQMSDANLTVTELQDGTPHCHEDIGGILRVNGKRAEALEGHRTTLANQRSEPSMVHG